MTQIIQQGIAILIMGWLVFLPATAEVYKWTDEYGRVHYGDRAPDDQAQPLQINPDNNSVATPADEAQRREDTRRLLRAFEEERRVKQQQQQQQHAEETQRRRRCNQARDRLKRYRHAGVLYDLDEQGERVVLGDTQRQQAEARAARDVQRWCN